MTIPKNITREHILQALELIDKKGYLPVNESRMYDLQFNDKTYPPKVVIAYANIVAKNKEKLSFDFYGGIQAANKFLQERGFVVIPKAENTKGISELIELYKEYIITPEYNELYKWIVIKNFQDNWDNESEDFATMLEDSLQPVNCNLWTGLNYLPRKIITSLAKKDPEDVRNMFRNLFDENKDLSERITIFQNKAKELVDVVNPEKILIISG